MAARITVITSRLVGSLVVAPSIKLSADCGSSIEWLITCAHPSVMMWLGWLLGCGRGGLCMYSRKEGKLLVPGRGRGCCGSRADALAAYSAGVGRPLERAAEAAAAAAGTLVDDGREGRFFFPTRDAVREMGAGVGLLAWLRSSGFVREREAVGTCIGGGGGRALGVMWGSASISESESSFPSSPQSAGGTFLSAPHSPIWGGRTGMGDHVSGLELMGSGELPGFCGLPDIFWREVGALVLQPSVPGARPQISQRRSGNRACGEWKEMYNSPEDTVDYWGELIRFCVRFGSGCIAFRRKGDTSFFFFFFFLTPIYYYTMYIISGMQPCGYGLSTGAGTI